MMTPVNFFVNGLPIKADESSSVKTLLRYLRDDLGLTGTKNGCSTGHCGACTVLVDGKPTKACTIHLNQLQGKKVLTIEGLESEGGLHPIQEAFLQTGAIQCGFCTPGMIMATKALLDKIPDPSDEEIKTALNDNICRCTGYVKIIEAVHLAAKLLTNKQSFHKPQGTGLGYSMEDIDGRAKVTGKLLFADDMKFKDMLYGKVVWSSYPHAKILNIDIREAEKQPGIVAVLTAKDVPGRNGFGSLKPNQPVICGDRVRYLGDPVAFVIGETVDAAASAVKLVKVDYEMLPGIFSPEDSLKEDSILLYPEGNICKHLLHEVGDIEKAKCDADVVVTGHFTTPFVEHGYLEPEAGIGLIDENGILTVYAPTQFPFEVKEQLPKIFDIPEDKTRTIVTPLGGGFGSKCDATVEFLVALGAYCTRRPVKLTLTRQESMRMSTKRHPYVMDYEVGATKEGKLLYVDAKLLSDAGPYDNLSPRVIDQACLFSCGPYVVPNVRVEGWAMYTNNANSSAFRGFGINQAAVAIEQLVDEIAIKLNIDPFELRLKNALDVGDSTISGEILKASVGIKETIRQVKNALDNELPTIDELSKKSKNKIGIGMACGFKNVGAGKGKIDDAGAILELQEDGNILLRASAVDMGQGIRTTLVQIAAQVLKVPERYFKIITGDTLLTPKHGGAVGERQTLISGNAVMKASQAFEQKLIDTAANLFNKDPHRLELNGPQIIDKSDNTVIALKTLALQAAQLNQKIAAEYIYIAPKTYALADKEARKNVPPEEYRNYPAYAYTTQVAIIEVNEETGKVKVLKVIAAHDVGKAINPVKIEGQIEGSCSMGQGYALSEQYIVEQGQHKTTTYNKLGIPKIEDTPEYKILIIEDPEPTGPFGAKGISEVATVPMTPAILNAIYNATGKRIYDLPATPEKIKNAISEHK